MKTIEVSNRVNVFRSYRAERVRSLFNVAPDAGAEFTVKADLPVDENDWQIGLIVGPSGSGKSTLGKAAWGPDAYHRGFCWGPGPIIEETARDGAFDAVSGALSAVGLGTVPSWLRPYDVLSTGEKFRADLARLLLEGPRQVVVDEFTSVVDRQIAKIGASAFAKAWRRQPGRQVILLSCHRDIVDWVAPDWVFDTETYAFARGRLWRRPPICVELFQTNWRPWRQTFEPHHYLKLPLMIGATCYVAVHKGEPVAHVAVATCTGLKTARMCRLVVLPEWQGAGVGVAFIEWVAEQWLAGRNRYGRPMTTVFHTSHPGLAAALRRRPSWMYLSGRVLGESGIKSAQTMAASRGRSGRGGSKYAGHMRAVQGFRYVGNGSNP